MYISEKEFEKYAQLILHLVAVDKDDVVFISSDYDHKYLVAALLRQAYQKGAKYVHHHIQSEYMTGIRAEFSPQEYLEYFSQSTIDFYKEVNDNKACVISIRAPEAPDVNTNVPSDKLKTVNSIRKNKLSFFHDSIITDKLSWIVVDCPTPGWAANIYPELGEEEGERKLWEVLKVILRLNHDNPMETWTQHQNMILRRRAYMNDKKYKALHFLSSGTDFRVHLHQKSKWLGAAHTSANGKYFQANLPTEEIYSSPDCRYTEGHIEVKRALPIFGRKVEGITMRFEKGAVVEAQASKGNDILQEYLNADERNRYLGEIALVDTESPIWKSKLLFNSILYDENAGVHFALGSAYTAGYGFKSGESSDPKTLLDMGCNVSNFHLDFVIGSEEMDVYGVCENGNEEPIISKGKFIKALNV